MVLVELRDTFVLENGAIEHTMGSMMQRGHPREVSVVHVVNVLDV